MSYALSSELDRMVQEKLAAGRYASEEEVLRAALRLLDEQEEVVAAIAEGYDDVRAGRHRPFDEANADFRRKHHIPRDE